MKVCEECKIKVKENDFLCPLCSNTLINFDDNTEQAMYPPNIEIKRAYDLVFKILLFVSVLTGILSIVINFIIEPSFLWSGIIISGLLYIWLAITNIIKKNTNVAFKILVQVFFLSILLVIIDYQTGNRGWAFSFAIPLTLSLGTVAVIILIIVNRTSWARYVLYQFLIALFGFITLLFYFTGLSKSLITTIVTSFISFGSLFATIIFGDKSIKNEFKRRFHF